MIFFLALQSDAEVQTFLTWAGDHLNKQQAQLLVAEGRSHDEEAAIRQDTRRFIGWTKKMHWLLG